MTSNARRAARRVAARAAHRVRAHPPLVSRRWPPQPPDWVGVGVQRAGTSWWHSLVERHPDVHALGWPAKELHFFDDFERRPLTPDDVARYHRHFRRPPGRLCGEWTPRYMFDPWTPALLRAAAPGARLLVLLRDPVDRYLSGVSHGVRHGMTLEAARAEALRRGLYHEQLRGLLEHFPRSHLLVLQFERCVDDPAAMLGLTYAFLGLSGADRVGVTADRMNRGGGRRELTAEERVLLRNAYAADVERLLAEFPEVDGRHWTQWRELNG